MTSESPETGQAGNGTPAPEGKGPSINRRTFAQAAVGVAAVGFAATLTGWSAARHFDREPAPTHTTRRVTARRVDHEVPLDPLAPAWQELPALDIHLMQQYMIEPRLPLEDKVSNISLRTMHNGREIGFHVTWEDERNDDLESSARFRDSVAVQLPVDPRQPVFVVMGQPGRPVHMMHWRASWQRAIERGTWTIRDFYPNAVSDLSPEDIMEPQDAKVFYPALAVGNDMAARERTSPVEELVAEGFGTTTSYEEQAAKGHGVHAGGKWQVVIVIPMAGGVNKATLRPGDESVVALAVWNGAKGDRGARKQFADWTGLEVEA
jgi:DMSO reductase family type II enzyme heme b subunit